MLVLNTVVYPTNVVNLALAKPSHKEKGKIFKISVHFQ